MNLSGRMQAVRIGSGLLSCNFSKTVRNSGFLRFAELFLYSEHSTADLQGAFGSSILRMTLFPVNGFAVFTA